MSLPLLIGKRPSRRGTRSGTINCHQTVHHTRPSTQPRRRLDETSSTTSRGFTKTDVAPQHSAAVGPTRSIMNTRSQHWQRKHKHPLHWPKSPQWPKDRVEVRVRKVVLVSTDEYKKGRRKGEQVQRMQAYYGQQRRRHLYDLGIANIKRLNVIFHTHSEEYWRGYADGLHSMSSRGNTV